MDVSRGLKMATALLVMVAIGVGVLPSRAEAEPSYTCFSCESWWNGSLGAYQHNDYQLFWNNLHGVMHSGGWIGPCAGSSGHWAYAGGA